MNPDEIKQPDQPSRDQRPRLGAGMKRSRWIFVLFGVLLLAAAAYKLFLPSRPAQMGAGGKATEAQRPFPVTAVPAKKADINVFLNGLGTVVPINTITVRSQVGGQLSRVLFVEGQVVEEGRLLAEIDPRPFQVQLMQAEGQLARDEALLKNALIDLARYKQLLAQDSIAAQQVTTQEALVDQYRGAVKTDQGQIASAKLQLTYSRVTAPVSGRVGLRLVDPGNIVQTTDATGIVVITQLRPITVVFSVPQVHLPTILGRMAKGAALPVYAYSQDGKALLATGTLSAVDNQIDTTTGTVKLKARFENKKNELFANQFVNASMKIDTLSGATVIPASALQRGTIGAYTYVVKADKTVTVRALQLGPSEGQNVVVTAGLEPGEIVVAVGGDKLREGVKVEMVTNEAPGTSSPKRIPRDGVKKGSR